jgi:hypothetical protein
VGKGSRAVLWERMPVCDDDEVEAIGEDGDRRC